MNDCRGLAILAAGVIALAGQVQWQTPGKFRTGFQRKHAKWMNIRDTRNSDGPRAASAAVQQAIPGVEAGLRPVNHQQSARCYSAGAWAREWIPGRFVVVFTDDMSVRSCSM
jgi:hypothetical protein